MADSLDNCSPLLGASPSPPLLAPFFSCIKCIFILNIHVSFFSNHQKSFRPPCSSTLNTCVMVKTCHKHCHKNGVYIMGFLTNHSLIPTLSQPEFQDFSTTWILGSWLALQERCYKDTPPMLSLKHTSHKTNYIRFHIIS